MPDPTKQTVSASQAAMLVNQSPYGTRWLLWQHFKNGVPLDAPENERMRWGKLLQHTILSATAEHYRLELQPNLADEYVRNGRLGCTLDGELLVPDAEPVIVEAKNVDWLRWKEGWTEKAAPLHIEIQLQEQMLVRGRQRGIIACFVGGNDILFYERDANPEIWGVLQREADAFFESLAANDEPDPMGSPLELPALAHLYPEADPMKTVEAMTAEAHEIVRMYRYGKEQEAFGRKLKEQMQARLLQLAGDAGLVRVPCFKAWIKKSLVAEQRQACPPGLQLVISALEPMIDPNSDEPMHVALRELVAWARNCERWPVARKGFVQARINIEEIAGEDVPAAEMEIVA